MTTIDIKFLQTHPNAKLPESKGSLETGFDIFASEDVILPGSAISPCNTGVVVGNVVVPTGITVADITPGYWFRIEPRSGMGFKHGIQPHLGVIDQTYRGDLAVKLYNFTARPYHITTGDRIAQLVIYPVIRANMSWSTDITSTYRGSNGLGHTGK